MDYSLLLLWKYLTDHWKNIIMFHPGHYDAAFSISKDLDWGLCFLMSS